MARNKHPEETVAKILDVSMRLFTEQGYEHTTIQDIVDALGMSKGAIYHHFKSKEDILDRINDRYYENLEWFSDPAKLPGRNGLEKLRHAFRHFLTDPAKREVDRLAIHHIVKNPKIALLTLESTFRDAAPYVEGMIRLGMADGSLPGVTHPHEIAEVLMLLTNVWTGMFPGSREEFAAKLRFCGEFLDRFGLPVLDVAGTQLGTLKDVISTGSNDVYVIAVPEGKDILVPALKKHVKEINVHDRRIVVELPEWTEAP